MMRTRWWHWVLGTYAILGIWVLGGPVVGTLAVIILEPADGGWRELAVQLSTFIAFFVATPLIWRYLLKRPVIQLVTDRPRINWRRVGEGFGIWFGLSLLSGAIDYTLNRDAYRFSFSLAAFIPFAVVALLLLPIQTTAEELFFRGWIIQWARRLPTIAVVAISGAVFSLPHLGNPEAAGSEIPALIAWFVLGAGWAYVSVRDRSIELAVGAHLANNLFAILLVGYDNAVLPTSSVLTTADLNLEGTAIALTVLMAIFIRLTRPRT